MKTCPILVKSRELTLTANEPANLRLHKFFEVVFTMFEYTRRCNKSSNILADNLIRPISEKLFRRAIEAVNNSLLVEDENTFGCVVQNRGVSSFVSCNFLITCHKLPAHVLQVASQA